MVSLYVGGVFNSSRDGSFIVQAIKSAKEVYIMFLKTGCKRVVEASNARKGNVKDYLLPRVFGVGFMGLGKYTKKENKKAYQLWHGMLMRCYYEGYLVNKPTYRECSVCEEWHNFQNFTDWFNENYVEGKHLDKDIKIKGNKTYSPEACSFVTLTENNIDSHAKAYLLTSPCRNEFEVYNLNEFCRVNNLTPSNIHKVISGERAHHKGWSAKKITN